MAQAEAGPPLAGEAVLSSRFRDPRIPDILVAAYESYLPADAIRNAERGLQAAAVGYASIFLLPEHTELDAMVQAGAEQVAGYVQLLSGGAFSLDPGDANLQACQGEILAGAIEEVRPDYFKELQATTWRILKRIGKCR